MARPDRYVTRVPSPGADNERSGTYSRRPAPLLARCASRVSLWCRSRFCCAGAAATCDVALSGHGQPFAASAAGPASVERLPEELLLRVLARLPRPRDLLACAGVNRRWRRLAADASLWPGGVLGSLAVYARFRRRWLCAAGREHLLESLRDALAPPLASPRADVLFCWTRDAVREHRALPVLIQVGRGAVCALPSPLADLVPDVGRRLVLFTEHFVALSEPASSHADRNVTRLAVFHYGNVVADAGAAADAAFRCVELRHCSQLRCATRLRAHCATHADSLAVFVQYEGVFAQLWDLASPERALALQLPGEMRGAEFQLGACSLCAEFLCALNRADCAVLLWSRGAGCATVHRLQLPCRAAELGRVQLFAGQTGFLYVADRWSRSMLTVYWCRTPAPKADASSASLAMHTLHLNDLVFSEEARPEETSFVVCRECIVFGCADGSIRVWDVAADGYRRIIFDAHTAAMKLRCVPDEGLLVSFARADGCVKLWDLDSAVLLRCLAFLTLGAPLAGLLPDDGHGVQPTATDFDVHVSRFAVIILHKKLVRERVLSTMLSYSFL